MRVGDEAEAAGAGTADAAFPPGPVWLIGCGNMAGAMLRRWLATGLDPSRVTVVRPSGRAVADGVTVLAAPPPDGAVPGTVILGVKPQKLAEVAPALAPVLGEPTLLVSILAGVGIGALRARFAAPAAIVRAMPNTPVALGRGVVGLCGEGAPGARAAAAAMMAPLGLVEWVDEGLFDVVTALAGSGPAFAYRFTDALAAAGARAGLDAAVAARLAVATVAGAGALMAAADEAPAALAARVASPGGSTAKGLAVLDEGEALATLLDRTIAAAVARNREMGAAG